MLVFLFIGKSFMWRICIVQFNRRYSAKLYVCLDRLCSNDLFLWIPETLRTKHFGHEQFTGYVRLRFFFLPARLIYSRTGSAASAERAQFPEKSRAYPPSIHPIAFLGFVYFQTFRIGRSVLIMNSLQPYLYPWPIFTSPRKNSWLTQVLLFIKLMVGDWKWSLSRFSSKTASNLASILCFRGTCVSWGISANE